ncbi:putative membrane protein, partial [Chlamydia psittaci 84-8471/1]
AALEFFLRLYLT